MSTVDVTVSVEVKQTEDAYWDNQSDIGSSKTKVGDDGLLRTADIAAQSKHKHSVIGNTGEVTPPASANYKHDHAMNFQTGNGYDEGEHRHTVYDDGDGHSHSIPRSTLRHYHPVDASGTGTVKVNNNEGGGQSGFSHSHNFKIKAHTHKFSMPNHTHIFNTPNHHHKFDLPNHEHKFDLPNHEHKFDLPGHQHKFDLPNHQHSIKIGRHQHDIEPGIFESGTPTQADLLINGTKKATITAASTEIDITEYLKKDGKVPRGEWIEIRIKPTNAAPNNMAYISVFGNVFAFIQSYTGGNF